MAKTLSFQLFELKESFSDSNFIKLPNTLRFDHSIKEEGRLFRLLTGSTTISNNITGEIIPQNQNYSILGKKEVKRFSKKMFLEYFSSATRLEDIDEYLRSANKKNSKLFDDVIHEFCYYFFYSHKGDHTLAFLHVYRILERMSYTFPMLYASAATDYVGTFSKLQNYFKKPDSELGFFKLFIEDFFDEESLEYKVKFNITAYNEEIRVKYYGVLMQLCNSNSPQIEVIANKPTDITIKNKDTLNLLIHLRNRYFHFRSGGEKNISSTELIDPNGFFCLVNDHFINWIAIIYFHLIKNAIK
jgi:hypothetical protein